MKSILNKSIDVIIPIYNAYEDLQVCLNSIRKNTDIKKHRIILINDNSPDERIRPFLDGIKSEGFLVYQPGRKGLC